MKIFLETSLLSVVPLAKNDSEEAAKMKPTKKDLLDSLIAATAKRYEAMLWTKDSDFLKFLPKDNVRLIS